MNMYLEQAAAQHKHAALRPPRDADHFDSVKGSRRSRVQSSCVSQGKPRVLPGGSHFLLFVFMPSHAVRERLSRVSVSVVVTRNSNSAYQKRGCLSRTERSWAVSEAMSGQFMPFLFKNEGAQVFGGTAAVCIAGLVISKLWFASSKPRHQPPP